MAKGGSKKGSRDKKTTYLAWVDFLRLMAEIEPQYLRFKLIIAMGCYTGLRFSDLMKLTWRQFLEHERLIVVETKTRNTNKNIVHRDIFINPRLRHIITSAHMMLSISNDDHIIFMNPNSGLPITIQHTMLMLKKLFKKYNVQYDTMSSISTHLFRKTWARRVYTVEGGNTLPRSDERLMLISHAFHHSTIAYTRFYLGITRDDLDVLYKTI
jgi:integrase